MPASPLRPVRRGRRASVIGTLLALLLVGAVLAVSNPRGILNYKVNETLPVQASGSVDTIYALNKDGTLLAYLGAPRSIFIVPTDGSSPPLDITGPFLDAYSIQFSPDDAYLVFSGRATHSALARLYTAPTDGGTPPVEIGSAVETRITADSQYIVFRSSGVEELYSVPLDGSQSPVRLNIPPLPHKVLSYQLSPDGTRAVYDVGSSPVGAVELYSVRVDGSESPIRLDGTPFPGGSIREFAISSDGSQVLYVAPEDSAATELYAVPIDGSLTATKLNGPLVAGGNVMSGRIGENGTTVVYRADQDTDGELSLYVVPIDGSQASLRVTPPPVTGGDVQLDNDYLITPDCTKVVYRADEETNNVFELFVAPLDGSQLSTKLSAPMGSGGDVVGPPDGPQRVALTPDGSRALYLADQDIDETYELFSVPVDASGPALKLNEPFPAARKVIQWDISGDGAWAIYRADPTVEGKHEIYQVPTDGSAPPQRLNAEFTNPLAFQQVTSFFLDAQRSFVAYRADETSVYDFEILGLRVGDDPPTLLLGAVPRIADGQVTDWRVDPRGEYVVYHSDQEPFDYPALYRRRLDASDQPVVLSGNLGQAIIADWDMSPDGNWVVYRAAAGQLSSRRVLGGPVVAIGDGLSVQSQPPGFVIAPDSQQVAFRSRADSQAPYELYRARLDGTESPLPISGAIVTDGDVERMTVLNDLTVVFLADKEVDEKDELFTVPLDGSTAPIKLNGVLPSTGDVGPDFFATPGGERAIWRADAEVNGRFELYSAPSNGSGRAVKISDDVTPGYVQQYSATPTADGQWVLYLASGDLYVTGADGSAPALRLSPPGGDTVAFDVSQDGAWVAYIADPDSPGLYNAYSVPIDGSLAPVKLNPPLVTGGEVTRVRIAPDSSRVLYLADQDTLFFAELYSAPIDGSSAPTKVNGYPAAGTRVADFRFAGQTGNVLYAALDASDEVELFLAPFQGDRAPVRVSGPMVDRGGLNYGSPRFEWCRFGPRVLYIAEQEMDTANELFATLLPVWLSDPHVQGTPPNAGAGPVRRP